MNKTGKQIAEFRWAEIFVYAAIGLGPLGFACASSAQAAPARFAIEASQVTAAMRDASLPVDGAVVKMAAPVTSSVAGAQVEIEGAAAVGPHEMRLRAACRDRSQCLPFFAGAIFPDTVDLKKLQIGRFTQVAASEGHSVAAGAMRSVSALRAGAPATLEFEADRIHVRLEVICLQPGGVGSHIRVSSLDHKQTYMAEVVTPTLLKGEFQQ